VGAQAEQAEEEERSRIDPLKEDLCMLRGLFLDALRKGSSEIKTLRAEPGHLVYHNYDTRDLDFKCAASNLDGIEQITDGVKSILRQSDAYAEEVCAAKLQSICEVSKKAEPFLVGKTACHHSHSSTNHFESPTAGGEQSVA
jgi:hypothetical protein